MIFAGDEDEELPTPDVPSYIQRSIVVSTDNAANITAAIRESDMQHIRCFAHTLNLSVQLFVKSAVDAQLASLRPIVKHFHKSPPADNLLKVSRPRHCACRQAG